MIKIYADGANIKSILELNADPSIDGFTTNPTLMKKDGIKNYEKFAKKILEEVTKKPISFEVFADDYTNMHRQALVISSWGKNVYVKIPVTNTDGAPNYDLMTLLSKIGVKINATAITTYNQIRRTEIALNTNTPSIISVFCGRIADLGYDPVPFIEFAIENKNPFQEILWASTREVYNIYQANDCNVDIITVPNVLLEKYRRLLGTSLEEMSLSTVKMFFNDASKSGYTL